VEGNFFDKKREAKFSSKSTGFKKECERLGLFRTRMPGFSQVFFYNFDSLEFKEGSGQSRMGSVVSRLAGEAYVQSGVWLESSCGISDVWYQYVESNTGQFTKQGRQTIDFSASLPVYPRADGKELKAMGSLFNWKKMHSRPRPTKRNMVVQTSTEEREEPGETSTGGRNGMVVVGSGVARIVRGENEPEGEHVVREIVNGVVTMLTVD